MNRLRTLHQEHPAAFSITVGVLAGVLVSALSHGNNTAPQQAASPAVYPAPAHVDSRGDASGVAAPAGMHGITANYVQKYLR